MKVRIYKYPTWFGIYQLVELLPISEEKAGKIASKIDETFPKLNNFFQWVHNKRIRKDKIKIEHFDTWSADYTLAKIIVPVLQQLKEVQHGAPFVDNEDVPKELQSTTEDVDELHFKKWNYVLDRMIQGFEHSIKDKEFPFLVEEEEFAAEGRRLFAKYFGGLWD